MYIYGIYFHQFHNKFNIKGQYFSIYNLSLWVLGPKGHGSSRVLGPLGSWVLQGPGSSRVLQSPGSLFSGMPKVSGRK